MRRCRSKGDRRYSALIKLQRRLQSRGSRGKLSKEPAPAHRIRSLHFIRASNWTFFEAKSGSASQSKDAAIVLARISAIELTSADFAFATVNASRQGAQVLLAGQPEAPIALCKVELRNVTDAEQFGKRGVKKSLILAGRNRNKNAFQITAMPAQFANPFANPTPFNGINSDRRDLIPPPFAPKC